MHSFSNDCRNDGLIGDSPRARLRLQHVHDVGAGSSIDNLHDDPEEIRIDKSDMLADNVPVTRRIHDGTFSAQFLHRTVLKLSAIDYFYGDGLT